MSLSGNRTSAPPAAVAGPVAGPGPAPAPATGLNPAQAQAVAHDGSPLLVLAGAGSGKTRVLVSRIQRLVDECAVDPQGILAITFTKKATAEMGQRLARALGSDRARRITVSTFHALGVQMLRRFGLSAGLVGQFGVADDASGLTRVRRVLRETGRPLNAPGERPSDVRGRLSTAKGLLAGALVDEAAAHPAGLAGALERYRAGDPAVWRQPGLATLLEAPDLDRFADQYARYGALLAADNAVDYEDLLALPAVLAASRPEVRRQWTGQWTHVLVDEYQDTDVVQDHLLQLLVGAHRRVTAVGDDAQAIYSWRGARVENIRTFPARFAPCAVVCLEDNYRSSPEILEAANACLHARASGAGATPKVLRTSNRPAGPVRVWQSTTQETEAAVLVRDLRAALEAGEITSYGDVFVLYRLNAAARAVEVACKRAGIPYRIASRLALHERAEARALLAYFRLADNPYDTVSFEQAVGTPPRGVGPAALEQLRARARAVVTPILDLVERPDSLEGLRPGVVAAVTEVRSLVQEVREETAEGGVAAALHALVERLGIRERLIGSMAASEAEDDDEAAEAVERRLNDLDDFLLYVEEFVQRRPDASRHLGALLEDLLLRERLQDAAEDAGAVETMGAVTLMSVHAAKGLEAPRVYVIGLEEGVFPLDVGRGPDAENAMSEEARLFYVAMTRAERQLILSSARTRELRRGEPRPMMPSRFLSDLPETAYRLEIYASDSVDGATALASGVSLPTAPPGDPLGPLV